MKDLFGNDSPILYPTRGTVPILKRWTKFAHYRKALPGSKEKCKFCDHCFQKKYSRRYFKCDLVGNSNGPSRDIRANHVCDLFFLATPGKEK